MKNLYQKTKGLVKALPFLFLAPTAKALAQNKGYVEIAGEYSPFTEDFLKDVYGYGIGGSIGGAIKVAGPLYLGGKITLLAGTGDYEREKSFTQEYSKTQSLSIVGLEPYIELSGNKTTPFVRIGYGNYYMNDQIRTQRRSWFRQSDYPDSEKENLSGLFASGGVKINIDDLIKDIKWDGSIIIEVGTRNASPIKQVYARGGVDFKF